GIALGTPLYMSPEQVQGQPVDTRSDIYSFGVTCYQMLTGLVPFHGETAVEIAVHQVTTQAVPLGQLRPDLPTELCGVVQRMIAKDPGQRYQTCSDLLKDLARVHAALAGRKDQGKDDKFSSPSRGLVKIWPAAADAIRRRWLAAGITTIG